MLNFNLEVNGETYEAITDWHCYPQSYSIGGAEPRYSTVIIPQMDGELYISEDYGGVTYGSRDIDIPMLIDDESPMEKKREIAALIQGKDVKIIFLNDPDCYYVGKANVRTLYTEKFQWKFDLQIHAEPYTYVSKRLFNMTSPTARIYSVGYETRIPVKLKFTTSASVSVAINTDLTPVTYNTYAAGTHIIDGLIPDANNACHVEFRNSAQITDISLIVGVIE